MLTQQSSEIEFAHTPTLSRRAGLDAVDDVTQTLGLAGRGIYPELILPVLRAASETPSFR